MKSEYRLGSVWGIPVNIHISLIILMVFLALQSGWMGLESGGWMGGLVSFLFIVVFEVFVFASIALHELGHSFVALRKGCRVREITLMFIGGAAKMETIPRKPLDEFMMSAAGPAVSLSIGGLFLSSAWLLYGSETIIVQSLYMLLFAVGTVNIVLACFNLLPAFPMDGGRIFRAIITPFLGRLHATRLAVSLGKVVAVLFVIGGLFGVPWIPFLKTGNVFLIFIAGFIFIYGNREYRMIQVEELMRQRGWRPTNHPLDAETEVDDDTVLISPPPFEKGPAERTSIRREDNHSSHRFDPWFKS